MKKYIFLSLNVFFYYKIKEIQIKGGIENGSTQKKEGNKSTAR